MLPHILAIASVIIASAALLRAFSLHRKLASLSESYWELRYDFGRLRARLAKIDGQSAEAEDPPEKT